MGPSIPRAEVEAVGARVLPPARRGDVWAVLSERPVAIALIDGLFETVPSIWHREILSAIEEGVAVFGASSMGALRAAELDRDGMIGVGSIYRWIKEGVVRDDAEVALLHADADFDFRPLTVPLVQVRAAVLAAVEDSLLSRAEARALVAAAERVHYQDRHWPELLASLRLPQDRRSHLERWVQTEAPDVKRDDARECLKLAAEYVRAAPPPIRHPSAMPSSWERRARLDPDELSRARARPDAAELAALGAQSFVAESLARAFGLDPARALARAQRLVPDGPGVDEALVLGARLEGRR